MATYLVVNGLGEFFDEGSDEDDDGEAGADGRRGVRAPAGGAVQAVGKAAFFLFLYLEVLDASFSFDGVVGAFAITSDPIIIAIGLGIGAMFIRSLTVFLVRKGTLSEYVYLEHGAFWAIGALAVLLLITIEYDVPEVVTGLIGVGLILAAFASSVVRNKRDGRRSGRRAGTCCRLRGTKLTAHAHRLHQAPGHPRRHRHLHRPAGAPPPPPPARAAAWPQQASGPVVLTKAAPTVSLTKSGGAGGVLRVNLNWNHGRPAAADSSRRPSNSTSTLAACGSSPTGRRASSRRWATRSSRSRSA